MPLYLQLTGMGHLLAQLLETFLELLLWNVFQYPEIFVPLRHNLFLEMPQIFRNQIRGIGWMFHFSNRFLGQKLLDRERLVSWSIVMVENPIVGPKFRPIHAQLHVTSSVFIPDTEESDEHCRNL